MSMKKATPKAVFEACQQLSLSMGEGESWNRDDVRLLVGGGSYAVIDPLIKAWRNLEPVREVAPSIPSELLIQVASLLEQQVSGYIAEVEQRDEQREFFFRQAGEELASNLHAVEDALTSDLELAQQAKHELDAECSRLEEELSLSQQEGYGLALKLELMEKELVQANQRLSSEKERYDRIIDQANKDKESLQVRLSEQNVQAIADCKLDYQQQLAAQKSQFLNAAELSENRLMRLLDQARVEMKELQQTYEGKLDAGSRQQQQDKAALNKQKLEINVLESELKLLKQGVEQQVLEHESQLLLANNEVTALRDQLLQQRSQGVQEDKSDLQAIKDSILTLQNQLQQRK